MGWMQDIMHGFASSVYSWWTRWNDDPVGYNGFCIKIKVFAREYFVH